MTSHAPEDDDIDSCYECPSCPNLCGTVFLNGNELECGSCEHHWAIPEDKAK